MLINEILDRIKSILSLKDDAALAREFDLKQQNIANWRSRGTVPWKEIYDCAVKNNLSLDLIFNLQSGKEASEHEFVVCGKDLVDSCKRLKMIYDSGDEYIRAIDANLKTFEKAIISNNKLEEAQREMQEFKQKYDDRLKTYEDNLKALMALHAPPEAGAVLVFPPKTS